MSEFILEFLTEDIPASMQEKASLDAKALFGDLVKSTKDIHVWIAKERLTLVSFQFELHDSSIKKRGPKVNAPDVAIQGFMRSVGVSSRDDLLINDQYFEFIQKLPSNNIENLVKEFLRKMPWPKTMRWHNPYNDSLTLPWVRPIRSIACVHKGQHVSFFLEDLGLQTTNLTRGHRFCSKTSIPVTTISEYKDSLKNEHILIDPKERLEALMLVLNDIGAVIDLDHVKETLGLIDYPFVLIGRIDNSFMSLPEIVLTTVMKVHQKYFALQKDGNIEPSFAVITDHPNAKNTLKGHERVLRARLKDAQFFLHQDLEKSLEDLIPDLDQVIYHKNLGTLGQKAKRLSSLMKTDLGKKAALLCKVDCLTSLVKEFPELQGHMGRIYSKDQIIGEAIFEHYLPVGDDLPKTEIGKELALRDKIDTLVGFLGVGIVPSGSKDPYALRRAALGVIKILIANAGYPCLFQWIKESIDSYTGLNPSTQDSVLSFISERFRFFMKDLDIDINTFNIADEPLFEVYHRIKIAKSALAVPDYLALWRRIKGFPIQNESCLYAAPLVQKLEILKDHLPHYQAYLNGLLGLIPECQDFFDRVIVLSEDASERKERLFVVYKMRTAFDVVFKEVLF